MTIIDSLFEQQNYSEIIRISNSYLANSDVKDSVFAEFTLSRAYANHLQGNFASAIPDWILVIDMRPDSLRYYNNLAYAYWSNDNLEKGLQTIKKAYSINDNDVQTISNLAFYSAESQQYKSCVKYASIGLKKEGLSDREKGLLLSNRANGYNGLRKYNKAEKDAYKSIQYFPDNSYVFYYRAVARFALGRPDEACEDLNRAKNLGGIMMTAKLLSEKCE